MLDVIHKNFRKKSWVAIFAREAILIVDICFFTFMVSHLKVVILLYVFHSPYKANFLNSHRDGWAQWFLIFFLHPLIAAVTQLWPLKALIILIDKRCETNWNDQLTTLTLSEALLQIVSSVDTQ